MTNTERRERRREAGRKAAATRRQRLVQVEPHQVEPGQDIRREQLRAVIAQAQEIRRESDLRHLAHVRRWSHRPIDWTPDQLRQARLFLDGFIRTDGTPQPHPVKRKGRTRL